MSTRSGAAFPDLRVASNHSSSHGAIHHHNLRLKLLLQLKGFQPSRLPRTEMSGSSSRMRRSRANSYDHPPAKTEILSAM